MNGDNVTNLDQRRQVQNGGNGGGEGNIRERIAKLEAELKHLATKTDIQNLKIWILGGIIGAVPVLVTLFLLAGKYLVN